MKLFLLMLVFVVFISFAENKNTKSQLNDFNSTIKHHAIYNVTNLHSDLSIENTKSMKKFFDIKKYSYFAGGDIGIPIQICSKNSNYVCYQISEKDEFVFPKYENESPKINDSWCSLKWKYKIMDISLPIKNIFTLYKTDKPFFYIYSVNFSNENQRSYIYNYDYGIISYKEYSKENGFVLHELISNFGLLSLSNKYLLNVQNNKYKTPVDSSKFYSCKDKN